MIPSKPVEIMTTENTIAIVIFSVFLGLAARALEPLHNPLLTAHPFHF
jgi:Na+/H+-dicarboxylate symporter